MALQNFRVRYLYFGMLDGTARAVDSPAGYFKHEMVVVADNHQEASRVVQDLGGTVIDIARQKATEETGLFGNKVSRNYKHKFLQAISFNVRAGLSAEKSLEEVILNELGPQRLALNNVLEALRRGYGFVEAIELLKWFDESTVAVLRAGEANGRLGQSLSTAVNFYQQSSSLMKLMFGAFAWTMVDLLMAVSVVAGIRFGLIEDLKKNPIRTEDEAKKQAFENALSWAEWTNNGLLIFACLFTFISLYIMSLVISKDEKTRNIGYKVLERIPVLRDIIKCGGVSSTCRVLGSLLEGGVLFLEALRICKRGSLSPSVTVFWDEIEAKTEQGYAPTQAFNHDFLEGSERLLLRTHRDQVQLAESLNSIAESRQERGAAAAKKFSIIAFLGSMFYSGAAVIICLFVVFLQNEVVLSGT